MSGLLDFSWGTLLPAVIQIVILFFAIYSVLYFLRGTRGRGARC